MTLRDTRTMVDMALSNLLLRIVLVKHRKRAPISTIVPFKSSKRKRRFWTKDEDKLLEDGVEKWGKGRWVIIQKNMRIENRTPCDLKDRWRNLHPYSCDVYSKHVYITNFTISIPTATIIKMRTISIQNLSPPRVFCSVSCIFFCTFSM